MHLFYKDWGRGRPVVFCHGGILGADMWEYQMTALAAGGLRCIAHDRRGCARSSHPGRERTARLIAGSLLEVYDTAHGLFITEMERLNRDLLSFING